MNKRHYEHTLPNIRGSLSNTYPQPAYAEQQISYRQEQEQNPEDLYPYYQRGQEVPTYRPEDYEEYPDFPQSMLEPNVSHYQSI